MGAVKRWNPSNEDGGPKFPREIMFLSDNTHENLITLLGFCEEKERIIVYAYAPNKSLDCHLKNPTFTWVQRLSICQDAARGLQYLHTPKGAQRVLHCDVKSAHISLDENWNAKVSDFGLSSYGPATLNRSYNRIYSLKRKAQLDMPILHLQRRRGLTQLEVLCSRLSADFSFDAAHPSLLKWVKNSSKEEIRDRIIDSNLRQQMEHHSFDMFLKLALQCVEREPTRRPSMDLIVRTLESALKYQGKIRFSKIKRASGFVLGVAVATVLL